jgi:D-apiose dehydrogenase
MGGFLMRLAVIGLGAAARNIHLPAYAALGGRISLVGGADPDATARNLAAGAGIPELFAEPAELLEKARPELVAVCSPPALHRDHVELALAAGCHVFCEKPVAESLEDVDAMIAAADSAGRLVVVNQEFPCMQIHRAARERIGSVEFGRLRYLAAWHTMRPSAATEAGWRGALRRRLGFEFGIHVLDLARFFFDATPSRVLAHMPAPDPASGWDPVNVIALEFADGRAASCVLDRLSPGAERYLDLRLDGEHAAIHTSIGGRLEASIGLHTRERRPFAELRWAGGGVAVLEQGSRSRVIATDGRNPFASATARHLGDFLDALERGSVPRAHLRDNRSTLALVLAAYESARIGRAVPIADGTGGAGSGAA